MEIRDDFFSTQVVELDRIRFVNGTKFMEFEYEGATVGEGYITFHLGDKRILET